jgi:UDP-N-acetylglucosamine 4,6-dehydratase
MSFIFDRNPELGKIIDGKIILITGGTGSFGNKMVETLLENYKPAKVIVYSRDEYKHSLMQQRFPHEKYPHLRFFIGDIRDYDRFLLASKNVNIIFHAAALKQVPVLEYNPSEAIETNINGTKKVIRAAIVNGVERMLALSTDKCVEPVNLYGATKLCMEKLMMAANSYSGKDGTKFSVTRYGNVFGSRGSVVPIFMKQKDSGVLTITDPTMTRFTITLQDAINFVLNCMYVMKGNEVFIPRIPSYNIMQIAKIIGPECEHKVIGMRPGEKLHELMFGKYESYLVRKYENYYIISTKNERVENDMTEYCSGDNEIISDILLKKIYEDYATSSDVH